ncbi:hypothetical protein [Pseudomonas sp. D2002]|uniref:hypothetical protein n=1 Tax=Pseudomonas sp. D2002 TaxID=2726980 RepID=UPI0015A46B92|nr:hypothetical protein [Pseudomonas sp. D2002]NWA85425.1 hypothetical protein [Pseudomonas sp. D2002]
MKTAYIDEPGVKPWEGRDQTNDPAFTTITLIDHEFISVWISWCEVAERLSKNWPIKQEWRSIDGAEFNSKTEEYLLKKSLSNELKSGDFFKKNEASKVYSVIKNRPSEPRKIDHQALQGSHDVILLLQKSSSEICDLWTSMTIFETSITAVKIHDYLKAHPSIILCRFYDSETHAAAQLSFSTEYKNEVITALNKITLVKISAEDVCCFINS